jgi:Domain of unknown function (DUF1707)
MPGDPRLRASDADREKTVALLREHHAVGRLTAEEFNDRLEQVYQARTLGELDTLLADLPAIDLYQLPSASIRRPGPSPRRSPRRREGPGAHLDRSADNSVAWQVARWTGLGVVSMLVWLGLAVATGGLAWIPWFLLIVIPVAVALGRHRPRPLSRQWRWSRTGQVSLTRKHANAARSPCGGASPCGIRRVV